MQRPIIGFVLDAVGDWTAGLSCGHAQHVRHHPPFVSRPWVTTAEGRAERLGLMLECVRCDRMELPDHFVAFKRTPVFTADSIPAGLRANHSTATGTWARIVVTEGTLRYRLADLGVDVQLSPRKEGVIVPEAPHSVDPARDVRFYVEFYRTPDRPEQ